ncbi:sporulation-specific protein 15-like isoform X1 [Hermetia illucens]|uniref:sporulation-specific protein 15-like isoform X1 n=1 Tax=Hermetia illucens TaxID=343691 RepID=UPI0018CC5FEA|nr:sporulation-specific protein 15-like isoform X1 [Hermetia illucens]
MAFSTQRDFINIPSRLNSEHAGSESETSERQPLTSTRIYNSILPNLADLWSRFSGKNEVPHRSKAGAENPNDLVQTGYYESDSGVNSEPQSERGITNFRHFGNNDNYEMHHNVTLDNVETMLQALQREGKFTVDRVMELIRKYQAYIKDLLVEEKLPEGGLKTLLGHIENYSTKILSTVENLTAPDGVKEDLVENVNYLMASLKTFMCETERENESMSQELQRVSFDRQSLQVSLDRLANVEDKILDLKTQASKANDLQKEILDLKKQLEDSQNNNAALVDCLMLAKQGQRDSESKFKSDCDKIFDEMKKWKSKAELVNDMYQREMLELEKWKIHCSRLSVELDKATERILRGHETKRKLYFSESMRTELERQIEEMMGIIKELNENKNANADARQECHPRCQKAVSNLLTQSKNTLQSILENVSEEVLKGREKSEQSIVQLKEENTKLRKEIENLKNKNDSERRLEEQVQKLQKELEKCKTPTRLNMTESGSTDKLREELRKCLEENAKLKSPKETSRDASINGELQETIKRLEKELEQCRKENVYLKSMATVNGNQSVEQLQSSQQVVVVSLGHPPELLNSNDCSRETQKSNPDHGDGGTEGIIIGPRSESLNQSFQDCQCAEELECAYTSDTLSETLSTSSSFGTSLLSHRKDLQIEHCSHEMQEVQLLLLRKDKKINQLEGECEALQQKLATLTDEMRKNETSKLNFEQIERKFSRLTEELQEQGNIIQSTKKQLKAQETELKRGATLLSYVQSKNETLIAENLRLQEEKCAKDAIKTEKDRLNDDRKNQDRDLEDLQAELEKSRRDTEEYRKEFNEKVRSLLEEKSRLETENARLAKELDGLDDVVDEINAERNKNRRLEELIGDLEQKLDHMHKRSIREQFTEAPSSFKQYIESLKDQLEKEVHENNCLRDQLVERTKELEVLKKSMMQRNYDCSKVKETRNKNDMRVLQYKLGSNDDMPLDYKQLTKELRAQVDREKQRYQQLHSKFIDYGKKIEELETKLANKKAHLERELENEGLQVVNFKQRESEESSHLSNNAPGKVKIIKDETKALHAELALEYKKNAKLAQKCKKLEAQIEELKDLCEMKENQIIFLKKKQKYYKQHNFNLYNLDNKPELENRLLQASNIQTQISSPAQTSQPLPKKSQESQDSSTSKSIECQSILESAEYQLPTRQSEVMDFKARRQGPLASELPLFKQSTTVSNINNRNYSKSGSATYLAAQTMAEKYVSPVRQSSRMIPHIEQQGCLTSQTYSTSESPECQSVLKEPEYRQTHAMSSITKQQEVSPSLSNESQSVPRISGNIIAYQSSTCKSGNKLKQHKRLPAESNENQNPSKGDGPPNVQQQVQLSNPSHQHAADMKICKCSRVGTCTHQIRVPIPKVESRGVSMTSEPPKYQSSLKSSDHQSRAISLQEKIAKASQETQTSESINFTSDAVKSEDHVLTVSKKKISTSESLDDQSIPRDAKYRPQDKPMGEVMEPQNHSTSESPACSSILKEDSSNLPARELGGQQIFTFESSEHPSKIGLGNNFVRDYSLPSQNTERRGAKLEQLDYECPSITSTSDEIYSEHKTYATQTTNNQLTLVGLANSFQEINDAIKQQLQAEKENSQILEHQVNSYKQEVEELSSKLDQSRSQVAQLQNILKRRESKIEELQEMVDSMKAGVGNHDERGIQTIDSPIASGAASRLLEPTLVHHRPFPGTNHLQNQLEAQIKRNYELTKDFSEEITNTQALKQELKQAQREIRKLCKCVEEVEQEKAKLNEEIQKLRDEITHMKSTCKEEASLDKKDEIERKKKNCGCNEPQCPKCRTLPAKSTQSKNTQGAQGRLRAICKKIEENGLESLDIRDLSFLHREVYTIGKNRRISESEPTHDKCWNFVSNLPPIPSNQEEKIMARVSYLETELDNANQVLQHLKKEYEKEAKNDGRDRQRGGETNKVPPKSVALVRKLVGKRIE